MVDEYLSAMPFSIPDPERSCLFHFTTSIESGSSFFSHCQKATWRSKEADKITVKERSSLCTQRVKI